MKIAIVLGTRPEIIKFSPIIRVCEMGNIDYFVIHTGQHYDFNMDEIFFEQLKLPKPKYNLNIKSSAPYRQGEHTGKMLIELEKILLKEMPSIVLVQGDTNTVLAGAIVTKKISTTKSFTGFDIKLGHVEACLRSNWNEMPEELNRKITDHLSDYLYAPTQESVKNALKENIDEKKIIVTGNTIVDALDQIKDKIKDSNILDKLEIEKQKYFLVTVHRQENVDSEDRFDGILQGLGKIYDKYKMPIIYPVHPRTQNIIKKFNIKMPEGVMAIDPLGFFEFLQLQKNALLVLTDSGGIQEEACILKVPCVTLRDNTERPETVDVGSNMIAGSDAGEILVCVDEMLSKPITWKNPFGDGKAAEKIVSHILKNV